MTIDAIARAAWNANVAHAHDPDHSCPGWHPQVVEVVDGLVVGDGWQGDVWPGGDPTVLLGDYHAHPRATHLVVVTEGRVETSAGAAAVHAVVCVSHSGEAVVLASSDDLPTRVDALRGDLYAAMVLALAQDDQYLSELADIGGAS